MTASASPRRMASASSAIAPPNRCTVCSTTMPSPMAATVSPRPPAPPGTACPVTSANSARAASLMHNRRAAGPTMSPNTAPASTEANCSGSPTRMRRASGRTASTRRAIRDRGTIDVSSTTTTSWGSRLSRLWRNRVRLPGLKPSRRCRVTPLRPRRRSLTTSSTGMAAAPVRTDSSRRAAAFPVGAARATRGGRRPAATACASSSASTRATVVVLPVPGPPATTETERRTAVAAARRWRSGPSSSSASISIPLSRRPNSSSSPRASAPRSTPGAGVAARSSRSAATWRSSVQRRSR